MTQQSDDQPSGPVPTLDLDAILRSVLSAVEEITKGVRRTLRRGVEQRLARQAHNLEVAGSSPVPVTKEPWTGRKVGDPWPASTAPGPCVPPGLNAFRSLRTIGIQHPIPRRRRR